MEKVQKPLRSRVYALARWLHLYASMLSLLVALTGFVLSLYFRKTRSAALSVALVGAGGLLLLVWLAIR